MSAIRAVAWYELRALLGLRLTPAVLGGATALVFASAATAGNSAVAFDTVAGEWSGWALFNGPLAQMALLLLAVWFGGVRFADVRGTGVEESLATLPARRWRVVIGMLVARTGLATMALLLPLLIVGAVHCQPWGPGPATIDALQLVTVGLGAALAMAYLVSGVFVLGVILPRTWLALAAGALGGSIWLLLAWIFIDTPVPGLDRAVAGLSQGLNPLWLWRCASLGLVPLTTLAGVLVALVVHPVLAVLVDRCVAYRYDLERRRHRLQVRWLALTGTLATGSLVILIVPALGLSGIPAAGGLPDLDLTRDATTQTGARLADGVGYDSPLHGLVARCDPVSTVDAPLLGAYLRRLAGRCDGDYAPGRQPGGWQGVLLRDGTGLDLAGVAPGPPAPVVVPDSRAPQGVRTLLVHAIAPDRNANRLAFLEQRLLAEVDSRPFELDQRRYRPRGEVLVLGRGLAPMWQTLLGAAGYRVVPAFDPRQIRTADPDETVVLLAPELPDIPPAAHEALNLFIDRGGPVLVQLPPILVTRVPQTQGSNEDVPRMAGGDAIRMPGELTDFLAGRGLLATHAEWYVSPGSADRVVLPGVGRTLRWRATAAPDLLRTPDSEGANTPVQVVVHEWATEPVPPDDGGTGTDPTGNRVPWVRQVWVESADAMTLRVPVQATPIDLVPVVVWWREAEHRRGALAVSLLEPFRPWADGRAIAGADERDLVCNLLAHLTGRPPEARHQRRKAPVAAIAGGGLDRDWVAIHQVAAYIFTALGLLLAITRLRRRSR